ncbi:MAG TPA: hypothetical protein VF782_02580 [Allosphingosinicella sp.]|jgi:hypothetical protein
MRSIDASILARIPLAEVEKVTFSKRDELATDLICCAVEASGRTWTFHEEMPGWDSLIRYLERLPGFDRDWFRSVSKPAFEPCETLAYQRQG